MNNEPMEYKENTNGVTGTPTGPWDSALDRLREWDPKWAELCFKMSTNPWTQSVLPRKFIELVSVSLNAACTNLNAGGTHHHIRAALEAGATCEEILFFLKCGSALSIHSCSLAAPVAQAQQYIAAGYGWVIDLDLEKFLDPSTQCPLIHEIGLVDRPLL